MNNIVADHLRKVVALTNISRDILVDAMTLDKTSDIEDVYNDLYKVRDIIQKLLMKENQQVRFKNEPEVLLKYFQDTND